MNLLGIDTETTGLHSTSNLLTLYMGLYVDNVLVSELDLKVKPNPETSERGQRPLYSVQADALAVNGINLVQHDLEAIPYRDAKKTIGSWLQDNYARYGMMIPFGNIVSGDVSKICECTVQRVTWDNFVDRRVIELTGIGRGLQLKGKIPMNQSLSLSKIAKYFDIEIEDGLLHTARYDVELGYRVLQKYLDLM